MKLGCRVLLFLCLCFSGPEVRRQWYLTEVGPERIDFKGCCSVS